MKFEYKAEELVDAKRTSDVRRSPAPRVVRPASPAGTWVKPLLGLAVALAVIVALGKFAWTAFRGSGYKTYAANVVLFDGQDCGASGFVVREGSSWWIYTNYHVADAIAKNPGSFTARLIDNTKIPLSVQEVEIAADRDLARFPIQGCTAPGLQLATREPIKDEPIVVLGNSLAQGVVTEAKGKILGYGPIEIEHDADTAPGNSGSPIIDREGFVIAVDARGNKTAEDRGLLKDSRYKQNRNFGERITDVPWRRLSELKGARDSAEGTNQDAPVPETSSSDAITVSDQTVRDYLTPSQDEIMHLANFIFNSPFVKNTPAYYQQLAEVSFVYSAKDDTVNAVASKTRVRNEDGTAVAFDKIEFFGGAARYARLVGLAYVKQISGERGALAKFVAHMPPGMCSRCSEEDAIEMIRSGGLAKVLNDEGLRQKAVSFSSGTIVSVISHEMGHHALGHLGRKKNLSPEITRNQEREADSFSSSVLSASPFGEYVFAGTLFWHYALSRQADGDSDQNSMHPLSRERFENFVRANRAKAADLGIDLK